MIKFILGAAFVVALVGYGVLTPETLEDAGSSMKQGVNTLASELKEYTEPSTIERVEDSIREITRND